MKKLLVACLLLALVSGLLSAQDEPRQLVFEPDSTFTVRDLGFTFLFPESWVFDASDGIQFAENDADLAAELDDDPATDAAGYALSLNAAAVEMLGLEAGSDINTIADLVIELTGLEVYERFEQPIMTYRGVVTTGVNNEGEEGIAIMWNQGPYVVVMALAPPAEVGLVRDVFYTFGYLLATLQPIIDVELTGTADVDWVDAFTIDYPDGWAAGATEDATYFVEDKGDITNVSDLDHRPAGRVVFFQSAPLEDLELEEGSDGRDVLALLETLDLYTDITDINEHLILDTVAVSARATAEGVDGEPVPAMVVIGVVEDAVFAFGAKAPDSEAMDTLVPVVLTMLNSIALPEEED
jgi:hypothetical protein